MNEFRRAIGEKAWHCYPGCDKSPEGPGVYEMMRLKSFLKGQKLCKDCLDMLKAGTSV